MVLIFNKKKFLFKKDNKIWPPKEFGLENNDELILHYDKYSRDLNNNTFSDELGNLVNY